MAVDDECTDVATVEDSVGNEEQGTAPPTKARRVVPETSKGNDAMIEKAYNIMTEIHERNSEKDEYQLFADLLASKIRKLRTPYAQATVQHKIHQIMYEAEQGMFDSPPSRNYHEFRTAPTSNYPVQSRYHCEDPPTLSVPLQSDVCSVTVHAPDNSSDEEHITEL